MEFYSFIFQTYNVESHEIEVCVMENNGKEIHREVSENKNAKRSKTEKITDELENWFYFQ